MDAILQVTSSAFVEGGMIPPQYTCDAANISPAIHWSGWPVQTQSFALLCEDPDAPGHLFTHWIVWNIPARLPELPERVPPDEILQSGAVQGKNDFGKVGYGGPCPPPGGAHHYRFTIFALDCALKLGPGATKEQLRAAMAGHQLAVGHLTGKYRRGASVPAR